MQQPFELKGSLFTLTVLHLQQVDLALIEQHLLEKVRQAPGFFQNIPAVIDLQAVDAAMPPDFAALSAMLRRNGLIAVAVRNGSEALLARALQAGLPALASTKASAAEPSSASQKPDSDRVPKLEEPPRAGSQRPSRMHGQPVRSGQQLYAQGADLIVIGAVSPGAEVLADGSVHVYGPLRGRALAGVNGDVEARIFCQSLEAELVAIAGNYRILEEVDDENRGTQMQIYLEQDRLVIESLVR